MRSLSALAVLTLVSTPASATVESPEGADAAPAVGDLPVVIEADLNGVRSTLTLGRPGQEDLPLGSPGDGLDAGPASIAAGVCQWPATVGLNSGSALCSGTLIHPKVVLYAAHCSGQADTQFGENSWDSNPVRRVKTARCEVMSGFSPGVRDFAYCVLAEELTGFPIAPPAMGCEREVSAGTPVVLAGYGTGFDPANPNRGGYKRYSPAKVQEVNANNFTAVTAANAGPRGGDSGGSAYVQGKDGVWRLLGVTSTADLTAGNFARYGFAALAVPWVEQQTGIDVTPCHDASGNWTPGPACTNFSTSADKAGGSWAMMCAGTWTGMLTECAPPSNGGAVAPPGPGTTPPGTTPPATVPPGAVPPGTTPPGVVPPGAVPPGTVPPGAVPPGTVPPGTTPPGAVPPVTTGVGTTGAPVTGATSGAVLTTTAASGNPTDGEGCACAATPVGLGLGSWLLLPGLGLAGLRRRRTR